MKKVAIFTTFYEWSRAYSLTSVVHDQLVAHVEHGYEPVLFVLESFKDFDKVPKGVEVRAVVPQIILEPYAGIGFPETWREDVERVKVALNEHAKDIDIMLAHDIVFIDTYLPYNIALREASLKCEFFHWVHSAPSPRPILEDNPHANRFNLPQRSKLVYLNHDKDVALAEMYGTWPRSVRVVHNSRDPRTAWVMQDFTKYLVNRFDLLSKDVISVYPVSTPRMIDGKQIGVAIRIHAALQKLGLKTTLVVPNAHANDVEAKRAITEMKELGSWNGLEPESLVFTSTLEIPKWEHGVPQEVVSDLFRLANVFIFPSISENCSLVLLEAMMAGNLLILNKDCSGLQEFGGDAALYFKMGNLDNGVRNRENALESVQYITDIAKIIVSELEVNRSLQAKRRAFKRHNYDAVFNKIEALYYEQEDTGNGR